MKLKNKEVEGGIGVDGVQVLVGDFGVWFLALWKESTDVDV